MGVGSAPIDDNGKPVLALWNDATGQPIPVHVGATVTGADGKTYALLDVNATVQAAANQRVNTHAGDIAAGSAVAGAFVDGADVTQGAKGDAAATDSTSSWSVVALLKGIIAKLLASIAVTQSGTWTVQPGNTANTTAWKVDGSGVTQPVSGTFWQATQPVSGTVTANQGGTWTMQDVAATSGGSTPSHTMSAASTNATSLKNTAGMVYGFSISNAASSARYFKLYDKNSAPTVGTDTPKMTVQVPANSTVIRVFAVGLVFSSGVAFAATGAITDTDTTTIGANDLSIDVDYK